MKKTLVTLLALVFVLGIAASAFAASNPFVDVPTTSWAYGAIQKLVAAGVIDGYGDGTFHGDKAMTRYEAAQMVAKAMAKEDMATAENKAMIDKLAVEFATELNNLGVRVAKLEAGASSIKFSGDARVRYSEQYAAASQFVKTAPVTGTDGVLNAAVPTRNTNDYLRFRLNMTSQVNDDTTFSGRIGTIQDAFGTVPGANNYAGLMLLDANFATKNVFDTGMTLTLGRQDVNIGPTGYFLATMGMVDAAKVGFAFEKGSVEIGYGDFSPMDQYSAAYTTSSFNKAIFANVKYPFGSAINLSAGYFGDVSGWKASLNPGDSSGTSGLEPEIDLTVVDLGVTAQLNPTVKLVGEYWQNTSGNNTAVYSTSKPSAYIARVAYKGVDPKVAGSFGVWAEYYSCQFGATATNVGSQYLPQGLSDFQTANIVNFQDNEKAWDVVAQYAIAKNITIDALQTFGTTNVTTHQAAGNFSRINVNYMF